MLNAASHALTVTVGVEFEDGTLERTLPAPQVLADTPVTFTLTTDENLEGVQFSLLASHDPDGDGPLPAVDATDRFQYTAQVQFFGKGTDPYTGPARLHGYLADRGVFDSTGFDDELFSHAHFIRGFGWTPLNLPTRLSDAEPTLLFRSVGETPVARLDADHNRMVTYPIASTGVLQPGTYRFHAGDLNRLGFLACNLNDCANARAGTAATLHVLPEPATAILLLAAVSLMWRIPRLRRGRQPTAAC